METWIDIPRADERDLEAHLAPTCGFWWVDPRELAGDETTGSDEDDLPENEGSDTHG